MKVLFYAKESSDVGADSGSLEKNYTFTLWKPRITNVVPQGTPMVPFVVWWTMHYLRLLGNRDYGLFLVFSGDAVVHRSCVFPRYFRFPFMDRVDLQIGDTWTAEEHRGRGLATFALKKIIELEKKTGRRFWYVTEESNIASIRAAENAGFAQIGRGQRIDRWGISVLGSYLLEN